MKYLINFLYTVYAVLALSIIGVHRGQVDRESVTVRKDFE